MSIYFNTSPSVIYFLIVEIEDLIMSNVSVFEILVNADIIFTKLGMDIFSLFINEVASDNKVALSLADINPCLAALTTLFNDSVP